MLRNPVVLPVLLLLLFVFSVNAKPVKNKPADKKQKYLYDAKTDKHIHETINRAMKMFKDGKDVEAIKLLVRGELEIKRKGLTIPKDPKPGTIILPSPYILTLGTMRLNGGAEPVELLDFYEITAFEYAFTENGDGGAKAFYESSKDKLTALAKLSLIYDTQKLLDLIPDAESILGKNKDFIDNFYSADFFAKSVPLYSIACTKAADLHWDGYSGKIRGWLKDEVKNIKVKQHIRKYLRASEGFTDFGDYCKHNKLNLILDSFLKLELIAYCVIPEAGSIYSVESLMEIYPDIYRNLCKNKHSKLLRLFINSKYQEYIKHYGKFIKYASDVSDDIELYNYLSLNYLGKKVSQNKIKDIAKDKLNTQILSEYQKQIGKDLSRAQIVFEAIRDYWPDSESFSPRFQKFFIKNLFKLNPESNSEECRNIILSLRRENDLIQRYFTYEITPLYSMGYYSQAKNRLDNFTDGLAIEKLSPKLLTLYSHINMATGNYTEAKKGFEIALSGDNTHYCQVAGFFLNNWEKFCSVDYQLLEKTKRNLESQSSITIFAGLVKNYIAKYHKGNFEGNLADDFLEIVQSCIRKQNFEHSKNLIGSFKSFFKPDLFDKIAFHKAYIDLIYGDIAGFEKYLENRNRKTLNDILLKSCLNSYPDFRRKLPAVFHNNPNTLINKYRDQGDFHSLYHIYLVCIIEDHEIKSKAESYFNIGYICLVQGDIDTAKKLFKYVKKYYPDDKNTIKAVKMLNRINLLTSS